MLSRHTPDRLALAASRAAKVLARAVGMRVATNFHPRLGPHNMRRSGNGRPEWPLLGRLRTRRDEGFRFLNVAVAQGKRSALGVEDTERTTKALRGIVGKRLMYRDSLPVDA